MDNLTQQIEEIEVLNSIYGSSWKSEDQSDLSYSIAVAPDVRLFVTLPPTYPSSEPPIYELLAPTLSSKQKMEINSELNAIYHNSNRGPVLFQWIEKLKEIIEMESKSDEASSGDSEKKIGEEKLESIDDVDRVQKKMYNVIHGPIIQDRKSTFQGHSCEIFSEDDVRCVMSLLLENKKIAQATHNILAYRIKLPNGALLQDCDDDGENHAGGRLLHLLQITNVVNVIVIVTRWYGGIHLGPDRFKHINNAAREALKAGNFLLS